MRILVISGSTRRASLNTALARLVSRARPRDGVTVEHALDRLPFYDGDLEADGVPPVVAELRETVDRADLVVVATPEYNGTTPGVLGNAIDWLSRPSGQSVLRGKPVVVISASPSPGGGARASAHVAQVLERIGAKVYGERLPVRGAHQVLGTPDGDERLVVELAALIAGAEAELTAVAA